MAVRLDPAARRSPGDSGRRRPESSWQRGAVLAAMAVVAVTGVWAISHGAPLLWDEAVYSLRVRDLVGEGARGHYWIEVRAPGLPLVLSPAVALLGEHDAVLRGTSLLLAVAGVALTWAITRLLLGPTYAVAAAWMLAIAPGWNESSWQVVPDIPGTVLTLAALTVILAATRGEQMSWWALLAAPLAGAATLVRYGAPLLIAPAVLAAFALRWRTIQASKVRSAMVLTATAAASAVVWFVPQVTGSSRPPVFIYSSRQDNKAIPAMESATDFLTRLGQLVGPIFGVIVVIGVVTAVVVAVHRRDLRGPVVANVLIALSVLVLLLFGIAEYHLRYLAPALPFLAIAAAVGVVELTRMTHTGVAITAAVVTGVLGLTSAGSVGLERADEMLRNAGPMRTAYEHVGSATSGPCVVLERNPAAEWYSGCASFRPSKLRWLAVDRMPRAGITSDEQVSAIVRRYPTGSNLRPEVEASLEEMAIDTVTISPRIEILDIGTVARLTAETEPGGLLEGL